MRCLLARLLIWFGAGLILSILIAWSFAAWSPITSQQMPLVTTAPREVSKDLGAADDGPTDSLMHVELTGRGVHGEIVFRIPWWADSNTQLEHSSIVAGWPLRCLEGEVYGIAARANDGLWGWPHEYKDLAGESLTAIDAAPLPTQLGPLRFEPDRILPLRPIWTGLALNACLYALAAWCLLCGPIAARRALREARGRCVSCGYDMREGASRVCPECGKPDGE